MMAWLRTFASRLYQACTTATVVIPLASIAAGVVERALPKPKLTVWVLEYHEEHTGRMVAAPVEPITAVSLEPEPQGDAGSRRRWISTYLFKLDSEPEEKDLGVRKDDDLRWRGVLFKFVVEDLGCERIRAQIGCKGVDGFVRSDTPPESAGRRAEFRGMLMKKAGWARIDILHAGPKKPQLAGKMDCKATGQETGIELGPDATLQDLHRVEVAGPPSLAAIWQGGLPFALRLLSLAGVGACLFYIVYIAATTPRSPKRPEAPEVQSESGDGLPPHPDGEVPAATPQEPGAPTSDASGNGGSDPAKE